MQGPTSPKAYFPAPPSTLQPPESSPSQLLPSRAPNDDLLQVAGFLRQLRLEHHLAQFLQQGFDDLSTLMDIQEMDLDALGIPLGHRRRLQRAIGERRGDLKASEQLVVRSHFPITLPKGNYLFSDNQTWLRSHSNPTF
jgi:hypothetical protein